MVESKEDILGEKKVLQKSFTKQKALIFS